MNIGSKCVVSTLQIYSIKKYYIPRSRPILIRCLGKILGTFSEQLPPAVDNCYNCGQIRSERNFARHRIGEILFVRSPPMVLGIF